VNKIILAHLYCKGFNKVMIAKKRLNRTAMCRLFLTPVVFLILTMILLGTSQSRAFGIEGTT
jgi:hypothetical protein